MKKEIITLAYWVGIGVGILTLGIVGLILDIFIKLSNFGIIFFLIQIAVGILILITISVKIKSKMKNKK